MDGATITHARTRTRTHTHRAGPTAAILNSNRMEAPLLSQTTTPVGQSAPRPAQGSGFNGAVGSNIPMVIPSANGGLAALASRPPYYWVYMCAGL